MDLLALLRSAVDVTARGQLRRLIPSAALVFLVAGLLAAGAPQEPPRFTSAAKWADGVKGVQLGLLILTVASVSVFLQPFLGYLASVIQGSRYLLPGPINEVLIRRFAWRRNRDENRWQQLMDTMAPQSLTPAQLLQLIAVDQRLMSNPSDERLTPTRLGNVLNAAEERVVTRYGLDPAIAIPRLRVLASERSVAAFDGTLSDLRFAADLTGALVLGSAVSTALLALHPAYLWLPAAILALAWVSYRNALTAAAQFAEAQLVLFDLNRFVLYDTLQRPRPTTPEEEREFGRKLTVRLFRGEFTDEPYTPPPA